MNIRTAKRRALTHFGRRHAWLQRCARSQARMRRQLGLYSATRNVGPSPAFDWFMAPFEGVPVRTMSRAEAVARFGGGA